MFPQVKKSKKLIYLDHAATTPVDSRVLRAMQPFLSSEFGNPSSLYEKGRQAALALEHARKQIADVLGARAGEIVFTAGGTESVNLAIAGVVRNYMKASKKQPHIVATSIEHHAVLSTLQTLKKQGCKVTLVPVDGEGFIKLDALKKAIKPETILVSVMYANNEIGTIEPIAKIGKLTAQINVKRSLNKLAPILFHTDACQAGSSLDLNVHKLGVDLLSVNGSKIYGPKQTGFLYVRNGVQIEPLVYGGGQEKGLRSGTENVAGAAGFAKALALAQAEREKENRRLTQLREYFISQLKKVLPDATLNGPNTLMTKLNGRSKMSYAISNRLPNNIHVSIPGVEGEALTLYLDSYNIAVSTGSACTTGTTDPSHVVLAIGRPKSWASQSIRFTLGRDTNKKDLDYVLKVLPGIVKELKKVTKLKTSR